MTEILTSAQMRALEQRAIATGQTTGLALMERAGEALYEALVQSWPDLAAPAAPRRAVILCGPGNNGGDGYVLARLLAQRGWRVTICATRDPADLPADAAANARRAAEIGLPILPLSAATLTTLLSAQDGVTVLVDALLGIGQTRPCDALLAPLRAALAQARATAPRADLRRLAIDLPSGIDSDTGEARASPPFTADLTVTFHSAKPGHLRGDGPRFCGRLVVKDIGL